MYRTYVSVLTQLDFCYMFEYVSSKKGKNLTLECNAELDRGGIDAKVGNILFQIAKVSQRKEARTVSRKKTIITIPYTVYNIEEFKKRMKSPRVKDESKIVYKKILESFYKYFEQLKNGFVVFKEYYLERIIDSIVEIRDNEYDVEKVRKIVMEISNELSGKS